jgi:hypothetical protein
MEFLHFPAHFHQPYQTNMSNTAEFYAVASGLLSNCVAGVGDADHPCSVAHVSRGGILILFACRYVLQIILIHVMYIGHRL